MSDWAVLVALIGLLTAAVYLKTRMEMDAGPARQRREDGHTDQ